MSILGAGVGFGTLAQADAADRLPKSAGEKLRALRQARDDAANTARPIFQSIEDKRAERRDCANRLRVLTDARGIGGFSLTPDDNQCKDVQKSIERLDREIGRLREAFDLRSDRAGTIGQLVRSLEDFVQVGRPPGCVFAPVEIEAPVLRKGEDIAAAIENRRRRLRELSADKHAAESALTPKAVVKAKAERQIDALATAGAPSVLNSVGFDAAFEIPTVTAKSDIRLEKEFGLGFAEIPDTLGLIAWTFRDQLLAAINAEIDRHSDDEHALDDATRAERLATIARDALAVGREEEALICLAAASGTEIMRRPNADPRAVLGLELISTAASRSGPMATVTRLIGGS